MVGIYKIVSPSGKIYIGQSWDINKRWISHRNYINGKQPILHNSFNKYGVSSHVFSIEHILPSDVKQNILDDYEIFFIAQYRESGANLLNLKEGGSTGKMAPKSREKMSISRKKSPFFKDFLERNKGNKWGLLNIGRKQTEEHRRNSGAARVGAVDPEETKTNKSNGAKRYWENLTDEQKKERGKKSMMGKSPEKQYRDRNGKGRFVSSVK